MSDSSKTICIVGGVAGGASCATRCRRLDEQAEIILYERGPYVSFANCGLPYHIGGAIAERDDLLVQTPQGLQKRYNIDVRIKHEVVAVNAADKTITVRDLDSDTESTQPYDALVLSPGAEPIRPPFARAAADRVLSLRNMEDMDTIIEAIEKRKPASVAVIGAGYIGLEMTEALHERSIGVDLIELLPQVFAPVDPEIAAPLAQHMQDKGIRLHLGHAVEAIEPTDRGVSLAMDHGRSIPADLVILAIGVKPEVDLARRAGLAIGKTGGIQVDAHMQTSDAAIWAVGDAVEVEHFVGQTPSLIPLAGPANRQGRIAADNIFGGQSVYKASQGTAVCKVFDLTVGMTGQSAKALDKLGRRYETVFVHPASHASYYPNACQITLKLLFDPAEGTILGAQAVGGESIDKRIDVLATAQRAGMRVQDLVDLELSYAPPYGSAKDPVNYAGFVASNAMTGLSPLCHTADMLDPGGAVLLDVRTAGEVAKGTIPGAMHIPIDELRSRLDELPKDKPIRVFCQVGLRGHLACRTLRLNGYEASNYTGGYKTFQAVTWTPAEGETVWDHTHQVPHQPGKNS